MGVYWRSTMALLSTLAALVIIVNSAEEDLEEYRRDLRPRVLDTGTTNYDLPWRAVKIEPMNTQSTQIDTWDGSPEDPPKRNRILRKRKRRPQAAPEVPQERYLERDQRPYNEENYRALTEMPHRRRKKIDIKHDGWINESAEKEKSLQRKGLKRRPEHEPWHEFSEFGDVPADESLDVNVGSQKHDRINYEDVDNNESREPRLTLSQFYNEERNRNVDAVGDVAEEENEDIASQFTLNKDNEYEEHNNPQIKEDKSLSEFSLENDTPARLSRNKNDEEIPIQDNLSDIKEQNKPLDPVSLKDILKKSNGKSLSELLQQNNLTLADLLNGQKNVLSVFESVDLSRNEKEVALKESSNQIPVVQTTIKPDPLNKVVDNQKEKSNFDELTSSEELVLSTRTFAPQTVTQTVVTSKPIDKYKLTPNIGSKINQPSIILLNETRNGLKRRFHTGVRVKLRMRPLVNNSHKGQLSRDMIALTTKRYHNNNRNYMKSREWKEFIPAIMNMTQAKSDISEEEKDNLTTTPVPEEITSTQEINQFNTIYLQSYNEAETDTVTTDTSPTTTTTFVTITEAKPTSTLKVTVPSKLRPGQNITFLRQQAFANRLKLKKLKQKLSPNDTSQEHLLKDLFDMANLVSASEFIAKIQPSPTTLRDQIETVTMLEDFMTTETTSKATAVRSTKRWRKREKAKTSTTTRPEIRVSTTEETAKIEIEEILNDNLTSAKLSKILKERNMTLNELVEHRERGSSHVHLADIFHNASKEPNPPEPFLSKSLIEPISKETYPLRALLEASSHESTAKPISTVPYNTPPQYITIPIMMDFGNNVNENGENSGITSLFKNFNKHDETVNIIDPKNGSTVIQKLNNELKININSSNRTSRQSHIIGNEQDLVTLNEIFSLIQKSHNITEDTPQILSNETTSSNRSVNTIVLEDVDGDGLIALEDLQQINELGQDTSASNEKMELNSLESLEVSPTLSNPETIHNNTRSVTVVTASLVGLIAVVFLLTYAAFKWRHQQQIFRNKNYTAEQQIPTPVFENRKSNKNSSMRSMSPMLSSNIYSVNTLEKPNNNECPEYMWDSLRKPFQ